mmetsp:Transcript_5246/g.20412  ORF Transcript_5246/g.20412 Transcript_5246/m.20412 type:complete len:238 (+) Transcript_5246:576-1289(+)
MADARPIKQAPTGPTKPAAGVMAARPAMDAVHVPRTETLPFSMTSSAVQTIAATDAESCVARHAKAAPAEAAPAEPPLKPNQPTHNMAVPRNVSTKLPWCILFSLRSPRYMAATRAPMPAVMCTTIPPAKSRTPMSAKNAPGPPQTMWHAGKYTANIHSVENHMTALNFMRSTSAPIMSAGVMIANVIWYNTHSASGIVPATDAAVTPAKPTLSQPPMKDANVVTPSFMPTSLNDSE